MPSVSSGFPSDTDKLAGSVFMASTSASSHIFLLLILEFQFAKMVSNLCLHVLVNTKLQITPLMDVVG